MLETIGDIWNFYEKEQAWVGIPTNGTLKKNGFAIMGGGVALQAVDRFPPMAEKLGAWINNSGNVVGVFPEYRLVTIPTKNNWFENSTTSLIDASCKQLKLIMNQPSLFYTIDKLYIPRLGCGLGQLSWDEVYPIINNYFSDDERLVIVHFQE